MCGCADCGQSDALLAGLMSGLTDPMHVGAWFRLGVEMSGWERLDDLFVDVGRIQSRLNGSGYVQGVQVYKQSGVVNPFIQIEGSSAREYGQSRHLKDAVLSVVGSLHPINAGSVQFEAETYSASTGEPTHTYEEAPINQSGPGAGSGIFDSLARQIGIQATEAKWLAIGGGVLLVVLLTRK